MGIVRKYIAPAILTVIVWLYLGSRLALDFIGWSTAPEDVGVALSRMDQMFAWLMSIPVWMPFLAATALTIMFVYSVSRQPAALSLAPSAAKLPTVRVPTLSGTYSDAHALEKTLAFETTDSRSGRPHPDAKIVSVGTRSKTRSFFTQMQGFDVATPAIPDQMTMKDARGAIEYLAVAMPFIARSQTAQLRAEAKAFIKNGRLA